MKQDEFDLRLTQEMADLPPDPGEVQDYNPWQAAMSRICLLYTSDAADE